MAEALRQLLAEFTVAFDREGNIARGNTAVDGLKSKLEGLQSTLSKPIPAPKIGAIQAPGGIKGAFASFKEGFNNGGGIGGLTSKVLSLRGALVGLGAGAAIGSMVSVVDHLGDIGESAARLGVSTDEFQRLDVLARQNATSVGALGTAFRTLASNAVDPTKESAAAFAKLGVETRAADGSFKSRNDLFFETAGALADVEDGTLRAQLAQKLYGRSAIELLPLLSQGRAGLEAQREDLAKLAVVSGDTIKAADELADKWVTMRLQLLAAGEPVIKRILIPVLEGATNLVLKLSNAVGGFLKQTGPLRMGLVAGALALSKFVGPISMLTSANFGRTLLGWVGGATKVALQFAKIAAAFLILEDVVGFFQGKDSVTGTLLDKVFGEGTAEGVLKTVQDLTAAFQDLWKWITGNGAGERAKQFFGELGDGLKLITNDVLGAVGIGGGGLNGPLRVGTTSTAPATIPLAAGQFGPPALAAGANSVTVGDTTVIVNGVDPNNAPAVARAAGAALGRSRDAVVAPYTSPAGILR